MEHRKSVGLAIYDPETEMILARSSTKNLEWIQWGGSLTSLISGEVYPFSIDDYPTSMRHFINSILEPRVKDLLESVEDRIVFLPLTYDTDEGDIMFEFEEAYR